MTTSRGRGARPPWTSTSPQIVPWPTSGTT
jgi:hypothetical protein